MPSMDIPSIYTALWAIFFFLRTQVQLAAPCIEMPRLQYPPSTYMQASLPSRGLVSPLVQQTKQSLICESESITRTEPISILNSRCNIHTLATP